MIKRIGRSSQTVKRTTLYILFQLKQRLKLKTITNLHFNQGQAKCSLKIKSFN